MQVNSDRRVLFRGGVPVAIPGGYFGEVGEVFRRWKMRSDGRYSSDFTEEASHLSGGEDDHHHRGVRVVAPGVPYSCWNVDEITGARIDPTAAAIILP